MSPPLRGVRSIADGVRGGKLDAAELGREVVSRLDVARPLNAVVHRRDERLLEDAAAASMRRRGALAGVPFVVKETICTRELPTCCGSALLDGFVSPIEATAVHRMLQAGALLAGKANCDEFGMGSSNENSIHGPARNPHDPERVPGGSSGGSAAAVACGAVPVALGSDTGGSVRQPAAFCGVVGLKPTWGRVSRWGLVAFASSLDQIGVIGRSVEDVGEVQRVIAGGDGLDATCAPPPLGVGGSARSPKNVGLLRELWQQLGAAAEVEDALDRAVREFERAGLRVRDRSLPAARGSLAIYYLLAQAEAASNLARFDGVRFGHRAMDAPGLAAMYGATRSRGFGPEVRRRILVGTAVLSAGYRDRYYLRAQRARAALRDELDRLLEVDDLLLLPTTPGPAFRLGERAGDPLAMYREDVFTVLASLGGHPAISVPAPRSAGRLPVGVQLIGRRFDEEGLLRAAALLEERGFRAEAA